MSKICIAKNVVAISENTGVEGSYGWDKGLPKRIPGKDKSSIVTLAIETMKRVFVSISGDFKTSKRLLYVPHGERRSAAQNYCS